MKPALVGSSVVSIAVSPSNTLGPVTAMVMALELAVFADESVTFATTE